MAKLNLSNVGGNFAALEANDYDATFTEWKESEQVGKSGYKFINVTFTLDEEVGARKVWMIMSYSPNAAFKVKELFLALGVDPEDMDGDDEDAVDANDTEAYANAIKEILAENIGAEVTVTLLKEPKKVKDQIVRDAQGEIIYNNPVKSVFPRKSSWITG